MPTEQGYSNQKKKGISQFKTIHNVGSDSFGTLNVPKYLFDLSLSDQSILSVADIIGKDGQVQYWNIEITAHGAYAGQVLRIVDGDLKNFEFEIISVPDVDHLYVLPISPTKPTAGLLARVFGWVTGQSDEDGNLLIQQTPIKFNLDGVPTEVSKDSLNPNNTLALPVEDYAARQSLSNLESVDFATETTLDDVKTAVQAIQAVDFATENTLSSLLAKTAGSLVPISYDQVVQTYVGSTNDLSTVIFKDGGITVATLTFTYDGSNRLIDVVRT